MARALLAGWIALALQSAAWAQHPLPPRERTLAERVARSDAVALARVASVESGRLHLVEARALRGEVPSEFEVKRSPLDPPPYEEGDLAVFFLVGARPPYLLADAPREMIRPANDAAAQELAKAVNGLVAAGDDRERILALHAAWLEGSDDTLRELAAETLVEPLPTEFVRERARIAMDAARPRGVRRASASVAVRDPEALALLVTWAPGAGSEADAAVVEVVLRRAAQERTPGTEAALLRTLASPTAELRRVGLLAASGLREHAGSALRQQIAALAEQDPDEEVRVEAARAARRLGLR